MFIMENSKMIANAAIFGMLTIIVLSVVGCLAYAIYRSFKYNFKDAIEDLKTFGIYIGMFVFICGIGFGVMFLFPHFADALINS